MKLSEYEAFSERKRSEAKKEHLDRCHALVRQAVDANLPLYAGELTPLVLLAVLPFDMAHDAAEERRKHFRAFLGCGRGSPQNIECDHCGTPLAVLDARPSPAPQIRVPVVCVGCGWAGSMST